MAGYKVYFGSNSTELDGVAAEGRSSPVDVGESTETEIPGLQNDTTTYVAVSVYDTGGLESGRSSGCLHRGLGEETGLGSFDALF